MNDIRLYHTKSLILRPIKQSDFEAVYQWENDSNNWLQSGVTEAYDKEEIFQYVSKSEDLFKDGQTRYIIELFDKNIIGCIDLFEYSAKHKMASVGLLIDSKYRKRGYGSEALSSLSFIAKSFYRLETLKALILSENQLSIKLFEKNGYVINAASPSVYHYDNKDYLQLTYFKKL